MNYLMCIELQVTLWNLFIYSKRLKNLYINSLCKNIHIICPASIQIGLKIVKRARLNYVRLQIIPSNLYTAGKNSLQQSR